MFVLVNSTTALDLDIVYLPINCKSENTDTSSSTFRNSGGLSERRRKN